MGSKTSWPFQLTITLAFISAEEHAFFFFEKTSKFNAKNQATSLFAIDSLFLVAMSSWTNFQINFSYDSFKAN